jgi:crotonobetainyl-CoA:carnitine CoA-transferase CaiB-like acyl-CoA transferase
MESPLRGVTVIEFCNVAAGPFCGMLLADMGADVIKVENPNGGSMATDHQRFQRKLCFTFNRNKRSVTLNLKSEADLDHA